MKLYKKTFLFISTSLFLIVSLFSNIKILITEIAPNESGDKTDWIEFFVLEDGNLENVEVYEGNALLKTFGNINLKKGDYFVLNLKSNEKDIFEKNQKGYYDFYSTDSGLVATKNQIKILDKEKNILDQVFYENKVGTYSDAFFLKNIKMGQSISRKVNENEFFNTNSSKNDFEISEIQTKGFFNGKEETNNEDDENDENLDLKILINEISPDNEEADWIEFFVSKGNGTLKDLSLYVGKTEIFKFPDAEVKEKEYFVLNFQAEEGKENIKTSFWNFYSDNSGLVATDSIIYIKYKNKFMDAICYADSDGFFSKSNKEVLLELIKNEVWDPLKYDENNLEKNCFIWKTDYTKTLKNKTISRKQDSFGLPIDKNTPLNFEVGKATKGEGKLVIEDTFLDKEAGIEFLQKTFSPYNDYKFNTIKIKYKNPKNTTLKIKIYDIRMRLIKNLIETDEEGLNFLEWNGKGNDNSIMPVGIYIFYYEFIDKNRGEILKGKKPIVLGKKL